MAAIPADGLIELFGTLDVLDDTSTLSVATTAFSEASVEWTNDDDSPEAAFTLECQFTTTPPTDFVGSIDLYAQHMNMLGSTPDTGVPSATNLNWYLGHFPIDWTIEADTGYHSVFRTTLPNLQPSQVYKFYFHNNATGQLITADWNMWIQPISVGPHA